MDNFIVDNIKSGVKLERPFINWWRFLFLSIITFGIFGIYYFAKRVNTVNSLINRKKELGKLFAQKYNRYNINYYNSIETINPYATIILIFVSLGFYLFVYIYRFNKMWQNIENCEKMFYLDICSLNNEKLHFDYLKYNDFLLNIFLSLLTGGIWLLIWDNKIHNKAGLLFSKIHKREEYLLRIL